MKKTYIKPAMQKYVLNQPYLLAGSTGAKSLNNSEGLTFSNGLNEEDV
jgi:hypothetical protein